MRDVLLQCVLFGFKYISIDCTCKINTQKYIKQAVRNKKKKNPAILHFLDIIRKPTAAEDI